MNTIQYVQTDDGRLSALTLYGDPEQMNWIPGASLWGTVRMPQGMTCRVARARTERDTLQETYTFCNPTAFDIVAQAGAIAICTPFNDSYEDTRTCMRARCHTHIHCDGPSSYVMALRMGGQAPHLGLALTRGALDSYSVVRSVEALSNDRGDFWLHPEEIWLLPGESYELQWELFAHEGVDSFFQILKRYPRCIWIKADRYVLFPGERLRLQSGAEPADVMFRADAVGEHTVSFHSRESAAHARLMVLPELATLAERRCRFITQKQQCLRRGSHLYGAYVVYDNETKSQYYSHENDHNGGRERMGMGALTALWLQDHPDEAMRQSLMLYREFVLRELIDPVSGVVCNDITHNNDLNRMYNYPWASVLLMEIYRLTGNRENLMCACQTLISYYAQGGKEFYGLGIPMTELCALLEQAAETELHERMRRLFLAHADRLMEVGADYPPSEVNYEQSIVAPAVDYLLMAYELSGKPAYLAAAEKQLALLELFNGRQPDYHLYEVAIRHWDGYWFGKRRLLGDTFPHYWSSLTGNVYARYARVTGKREYAVRAEAALRGTLSMFFEDGSASCAMLWPRTVNGKPGRFFDPWANDQDWGLYYYLKYQNARSVT